MQGTAIQNVVDNYLSTPVVVSYEDMANPLRSGAVVDHRSGEFRIMWDDEDEGETWTDLRQVGWKLAEAETSDGDIENGPSSADAEATYRDYHRDGVKHPGVEVELTGQDGNAFSILGRVAKAMRRAGLTAAQINEYQAEATSGNYDQLLETTMRYVEVN